LQSCIDDQRIIIEDELIADAIDMHAHVYPEVSLSFRGRVTMVSGQNRSQFEDGGFVMKSHLAHVGMLASTQFPGGGCEA
jgi:hypothetical protein